MRIWAGRSARHNDQERAMGEGYRNRLEIQAVLGLVVRRRV
jgi:hypothetical protein